MSGLEDASLNNASKHGRKMILPSSFVGSARYMAQLFQDAISIVRKFGEPNFFITFTCNPQ
jgi:hypothetical protein